MIKRVFVVVVVLFLLSVPSFAYSPSPQYAVSTAVYEQFAAYSLRGDDWVIWQDSQYITYMASGDLYVDGNYIRWSEPVTLYTYNSSSMPTGQNQVRYSSMMSNSGFLYNDPSIKIYGRVDGVSMGDPANAAFTNAYIQRVIYSGGLTLMVFAVLAYVMYRFAVFMVGRDWIL